MVFVLSEERLQLPKSIFAELSPKRKLSHSGILAIGGFCIDPGYKGRLLIGLFNFSSTRFPLIPGKKVIAATFYQLSEVEADGIPEPEASVEDFPDELVAVMQSYKPVSIASLSDLVSKLRSELDLLRSDIRSQDEWYRRFQQSLDGHDRQIGDLITSLKSEQAARESGHDKLSDAIAKISSTLTWLKGAAAVAVTIMTLVAAPIFVEWLKKQFHL